MKWREGPAVCSRRKAFLVENQVSLKVSYQTNSEGSELEIIHKPNHLVWGTSCKKWKKQLQKGPGGYMTFLCSRKP